MKLPSFITQLIDGAREAEYRADFDYDADMNRYVTLALEPPAKILAVASTAELLNSKLRVLQADRVYLKDTIATLSEELHQTEIAIKSLEAAADVLVQSSKPIATGIRSVPAA